MDEDATKLSLENQTLRDALAASEELRKRNLLDFRSMLNQLHDLSLLDNDPKVSMKIAKFKIKLDNKK